MVNFVTIIYKIKANYVTNLIPKVRKDQSLCIWPVHPFQWPSWAAAQCQLILSLRNRLPVQMTSPWYLACSIALSVYCYVYFSLSISFNASYFLIWSKRTIELNSGNKSLTFCMQFLVLFQLNALKWRVHQMVRVPLHIHLNINIWMT